MIKIAVVDDEWHGRHRLRKFIEDTNGLLLVGIYETGEEILDHVSREYLDVVFLDIEMPGQNGLQLFKQIQAMDPRIDIVFVTAHKDYAIEAFELNAFDYLLKPVTEERFMKSILRIKHKRRPGGNIVQKPQVQCLGDFEIFVNGIAIVWKNSKAKEIMAFLVQKAGVPVGWEKIADAVWPDFNAEKAQTNFHATTYLLRKLLSEAGASELLESGRGKYRVVPEKFTCDYYDLEKKLEYGQTHREEDFNLMERLVQEGYLEGSGYEWAIGKGADLEFECFRLLNKRNEKKNREKQGSI